MRNLFYSTALALLLVPVAVFANELEEVFVDWKGLEDAEELDEDEQLRSKRDNVEFSGSVPVLAGGKAVVEYERGSDDEDEECYIQADGVWECDVEFDKDGTWKVRVYYYDAHNREVGKSDKYKIKIDTEDPEFTDLPVRLVKRAGDRLWWKATDNDKIKRYKVYFNGKKWKTKTPEFHIPEGTPAGNYMLQVRAYDKAGNKEVRFVQVHVY